MVLKLAWRNTSNRLFIILFLRFRNKVVIIVNTASACGFTNSNYTQLKELLDKYKDQGLEVAAFPCNQFGKQVTVVFSFNAFLGARL